MSRGQVDARPWLIISRREAYAIYQALITRLDEESEVGRAVRQIRTQLTWLEAHRDSTVAEAIRREYES